MKKMMFYTLSLVIGLTESISSVAHPLIRANHQVGNVRNEEKNKKNSYMTVSTTIHKDFNLPRTERNCIVCTQAHALSPQIRILTRKYNRRRLGQIENYSGGYGRAWTLGLVIAQHLGEIINGLDELRIQIDEVIASGHTHDHTSTEVSVFDSQLERIMLGISEFEYLYLQKLREEGESKRCSRNPSRHRTQLSMNGKKQEKFSKSSVKKALSWSKSLNNDVKVRSRLTLKS